MRVTSSGSDLYKTWRRTILCGFLLVGFCVVPIRAQDVADAARQEKRRKDVAEQKSTRHVYTEDDLKRDVILTPEDLARVEARKLQQAGAPAEQNAEQRPDEGVPWTESLGEIARRYRQEQAARDAELAAEKKFTTFPYQVPGAAMAAPKLRAGPVNVALPSSKVNSARTIRPSAPSGPVKSGSRAKVSPFQPRHLNDVTPVPATAVPVIPAEAVPSPIAPSNAETPHAETRISAAAASLRLRSIQVQVGQSWWKLAELYLGSGSRWPELRELNAHAYGPAELLTLGSTVVVPETAPETLVSPSIKVSLGDSLWSLAQKYLGRGTAWRCLATANPLIVDFTHLAVGSSLRLPPDDSLRACQSPQTKNETK